MFLKEFEIRWNDLDANRHLANVSYLSYASETRMAFLNQIGLSHRDLQKNSIGPIVFNEQLFYFKEVMGDDKIRVSFELAGVSEDGTFFSFEHNFYNQKGQNVARCEMMGAWINLTTRKLSSLPPAFTSQFEGAFKTEEYKILTSKDTRKHGKLPKDISL
jgi:acyl-CoA thioester hydrolase